MLSTMNILSGKTDSIPQTYIGIRGGTTFTQMLSSPGVSQRFLQGISAGVALKQVNEKGLGIQIELNYAEGGWEEILPDNQQYSRKISYLELPFFTHITIGKGAFRPFIQLGSYFAWRLTDQETVQVSDPTDGRYFYYGARIPVFSYGVGGGLGFSLKTKIGSFQIEGRYLNGLRNNFDLLELRDEAMQTFTSALHMQIGGYFSYWINL